jgi:hypothetical protein
MLGFIIPLKSQKVSSNWDIVCRNLMRTLSSISNQSCNEYRAVVVCNELPALGDLNINVEYIQIDLLVIPSTRIEKESDKNRKISTGLNVFMNDDRISHVMILDADDCVTSSLVEFVCSNKISNGWFMNSGFEYPDASKIIYFRDHNMHQRTGSSHVIRKNLLKKYAASPFESVGIEFPDHQNICAEMASSGTPLEPFPYPGVVYIVENGENIYCNRKERFLSPQSFMDAVRIYGGIIRRTFIARRLSDEIRHEFSLYPISEEPILRKLDEELRRV